MAETDIYKIKLGSDTYNLPFLPLSGGTMSGNITFGDGAQGMIKYGTWTNTGLGSYPLPSLGSAGIGIFARPSKSTDEGGLIVTEDTCMIFNSADQGWSFQVHNTDLSQKNFSGTDGAGEVTRVFGIQDVDSYAWSKGGYKKEGSSDSYVLLGGGGHKAVSDFLTSLPSHTHTKSQITDFPTSLPASDVYDWAKAANKPTYKFSEITEKIVASNEFNFLDKSYSQEYVWINYAPQGTRDAITKNVSEFKFANGNSAGGFANLRAKGFIKNGKDDNDVLLAGGGSKALSDFLTSLPSHTHTKSEITDFPTSLPASDVYAWAKTASKPSYSHNEITAGNLTIGDGANSLFFRTNGSWASSIYHNTSSDEAVVFLNKGKNVNGIKNYTTSWIFAYGAPADRPAWTGLTPAMQIKGESVVINKLLGSTVGASYNLDVNGSANATTLYENGTRVSLDGHTHTSFASAVSFAAGLSSSANVTVTGKVSATQGFYEESDERLKSFKDPLKVDLEKLSKLRKSYFTFNSDQDNLQIGVSAQEIQSLYPELVAENENGNLTVAYDKLSVIALAAVDQLSEENIKLKQQNEEILKRLEKIEKLLSI